MRASMEEDLQQIADIQDLKLAKNKRTSRKGKLTLLFGYLRSIDTTSANLLRTSEIQRKLDEALRSSSLFDALQDRVEQLSASVPNFDMEVEQSQAASQRDENDMLIKKLETKLHIATLFYKGEALLEDMTDYHKRNSYTGSSAIRALSQLTKDLRQYREESGPYRSIEEIGTMCRNLGDLLNEITERVDEGDKSYSEKSTSESVTPARIQPYSKLHLDPPTFSGKPVDWADFIRMFSAAMDKNDDYLVDAEKSCFLLKAMTTEESRAIVRRTARGPDSYNSALEALKDQYGRPRMVYPHHVRALLKPDNYTYDLAGIRRMLAVWGEHMYGLELNKGNTLDQFLAVILLDRLDEGMKFDWNKQAQDLKDPPSVREMLKYFEKRQFGMEEVKRPSSNFVRPHHSKKPKVALVAEGQTPTVPKCYICKENFHPTFRCSKFLSWDTARRIKHSKSNGLCLNCLSKSHVLKDCHSQKCCRHCYGRHHTLLHQDATPSGEEATKEATSNDVRCLRVQTVQNAILLTAITEVSDGPCRQRVRALLDSGAAVSLVTEKLAKRLKSKRHSHPLDITGIAGGMRSKGYVCLNFASVNRSQEDFITAKCYVVPSLPIITAPTNVDQLLQLPVIKGKTPIADPNLGGQTDVLLGMSDFTRTIRGFDRSQDGSILTFKTIFGWTLGGTVRDNAASTHVFKVVGEESRADEMLQKLWQLEQFPDNSPLTVDEQLAVTHFADNHEVLPSGRFSVRLPRKCPASVLGESRSVAVRRYLQNERALRKKGQLLQFEDVLREYESLDHAEIVPLPEIEKPVTNIFYLPVHGVAKETSTTTKLRAVFDASAKSSTGISLNDQLLTGPNVYPLLSTVINRFRVHSIALTADVSKMFREICLHPDECDYHRFLLRDTAGELRDLRMKRLTFGVSSSPFLATQVLRQLAENHRHQFPEAAEVVLNSFYVDDCLTGASTVKLAIQLREQLCQLLQIAGMLLRKWRSNSVDLLATVPEELKESGDLIITEPTMSLKTLGIHWDVRLDNLHVAVPSIEDLPSPTKRDIASSAAKVFDIMGWYSPSILIVKLLLQKLWRRKIGWDDVIPQDIADLWCSWKDQLGELTTNPLQRRFSQTDLPIFNRQLHGFADASGVAYGGVVYLRILFVDASVCVSIVTAKSRVAPVDAPSIPRLELCAAKLTADLLKATAADLSIPAEDMFAWSDSTSVLGWINKPSGNFKAFVAHWVASIQETVPSGQWRHVPTTDNPADIASRGTLPRDLIGHRLWWHGPTWLSLPPIRWPPPVQKLPIEKLTELKPTSNVLQAEAPDYQLWLNYSSYTKLIRVVAWCRRFIHNCSAKSKQELCSTLTHLEVAEARKALYRAAQRQSYQETLVALREGKVIGKTNPLHCLFPHIAKDDLLRVGGRVRKADQFKVPQDLILLDVRHPLVRLMLQTLHQETNHSGPATLLAILSEQFYITGVKRFLKSISRKCVKCQKAYARTQNQQMGMLPSVRTTPAPAFLSVGIDFAGPFSFNEGTQGDPQSSRLMHVSMSACTPKLCMLNCVQSLPLKHSWPHSVDSAQDEEHRVMCTLITVRIS